jgi:hypothetical protein
LAAKNLFLFDFAKDFENGWKKNQIALEVEQGMAEGSLVELGNDDLLEIGDLRCVLTEQV